MVDVTKIPEELQNIVPGRIVTNVKPYLKDSWPLLWISPEEEGSTPVAVRPLNAEEVAKVVKYAASEGLKILCRGGGSSVTGASIPHGEIVVDTAGMNQVLDLDEDNRTVTAQAGVRLSDLEQKLNGKGLTLGQFPQSYEVATVGGYVSTMGTGDYSGRYGGIENSVMRLQVVLPDGEVAWTRTRGTPRSSVGPDLAHLFIGAEGIFGIVSAAELKIHRLPKHSWRAAWLFEEFTAAVGAARSLMDLDIRPEVGIVFNETESNYFFGKTKPVLFLQYEFTSPTVKDAVVGEVRDTAGLMENRSDPSLAELWTERRFAYREQIEAVRNAGYILETAEIGCKWSVVLETYADVITTLGQTDGVAGLGAQVSHLCEQGACASFRIVLKPDERLYWSVWNALSRVVERHGATLSHHQGVGVLKAGLVRKEYPVSLLRLLKSGVDPKGTVGPRSLS